MTKNRVVLQTRTGALAQQIGPSFCIRKILPAAPFISIQVVVGMLPPTLVVAVVAETY
jgi:hypothetical protein